MGDHICACLHFLCNCTTSWLTSVKGWRKKRNLKNIQFLYLRWNLAAGEKRNVFNILTEERDYTSHPQTGKICKLMNETLSEKLHQKPQSSLRYQPGLNPVLRRQRVSSQKVRLGGHNLLHSVFSFSEHFSYFLIFHLSLKMIIQSVSLLHIRLYQFDFVWCRGEGKQQWDVTLTLSWVLFVSTRVWWDKASERPAVKDSHCFVSAYTNVLEDYIWEKAFQAVAGSTYIFSLRAELIRAHWQKGGDDVNLQVRGLMTDRRNT